MISRERWVRLKALLEPTLELTPEEVPAYLDQVCRGDTALREDAERLLRACDEAGRSLDFLDSPAAEFAAPLVELGVLSLESPTELEPRPPLVVALVTLLAASCAAKTDPSFGEQREPAFVIDGRPVYASTNNLLEALRPLISPSRLRLTGAFPEDEPLLVVDGVRLVDTARSLAGIRAADMRRVTTLSGREAFLRFGHVANKGAIIVETRTGARRR